MADGIPNPAGPGGSSGATPPQIPPPPGASPQAGPSTGSSPATMPVANRGDQAAGLAHLAVAVHVLEEALPLLGMGTEAGVAVHGILPRLAKHTPSGAISPGIENAVLQKIMMKNRQNSMNVAQMRAQQMPPRPGGAPPGAPPMPGAAPPQPAAA